MGAIRPALVASAPEPDEDVRPDKELFQRAEDILTSMANTVSAMKLFPSDHATVRTFVDALNAKFQGFFRSYARLEIGVEEFSFTCAGQVVYTDETMIKSLPFFFFKDGTQILYFYRGLDRPELLAFLELIRTVSQKPGGDNDIVAALWESEFSNIQYYAPDEFLENQILAEKREAHEDQNLPELPSDLAHETLEVKVDLDKFNQGRIELKLEDLDKRQWRPGIDEDAPEAGPVDAPEEGDEAPPGPEDSSGQAPSPAAAADPNLTESEVREIDAMVHANRILWPEEEFANLTAEVVFLEDDLDICAASLDVLFEFHLEQLRQGQFPASTMIIGKVRELRSHLGTISTRKSALVDACLKKLVGPRALEAVAAHLGTQGSVDWIVLLAFLKLLGPMTLPMAAGFFEAQRDPEVRARILAFMEETGGHDAALIVRLANDSRPALSMEVIRMLIRMPDQKGIAHLSAFLMFKNRDIKLEVIHALGDKRDEMSNRILMGFLNDPDEELRIQAAMKLNPTEEKSRIVHVIHEASEPGFRKKRLKEKQAILSFLGRTRSAEALTFLSGVLGRTTLFPSAKNLEMRLAAVAGLESMGTAEASAVLEECAKARGRKVREACAEALARLVQGRAARP